VHDWVVIGLPPAQPFGEEDKTVLVCCPSTEQVDHAEYVQEVQVGGV
jgi:hypothetical protein